MPAFYPQRPSASQQLPLTPPDSGSGYGYSNMHYPQEPFVPQSSMAPSRHESPYGYTHPGYMQPAVAPAPPTYQYTATGFSSNTNSLPPIQSYYEPVGAPILPPLRINDPMSFADDYQRRVQQEQQSAVAREQQRQAAKEEKATGGVSAKLDYDMERMTDFVTEATQSIFQHTMQNQSSFRKWVHQVLSATRLPSATILLSLHYLSDRITVYGDSVGAGENQIYRLLAVALILGSKFLDDNTFINRSWSDVTAIKVTELNQLEMKWLQLIRYHLHVDPDKANGLQEWINAWRDYDAKYVAKQQAAARLSPLDTTNVHRHGSHHREHRYSPYPSPYSAAPSQSYGTPTSTRSTQYSSATTYSSVDPWTASSERHNYEDYYKRQTRYPSYSELDEAARRASEERSRYNSANVYSQQTQSSYYQAPQTYSNSPWQEQPWNAAHRYDCACSGCVYQSHYRSYPMAPGYSAQAVMG